MLHVPDAEATFARALERGATEFRPVTDNHGARRGELRDPFGHRWFIATAVADDVPVEDAPGRRFGDIGYLTLEVPDGNRARAFYERVFGWSTDASGEPGSFHISSITPPSGIHGGPETPEFRVYFRVDDIEAAAARVREAGGEVISTASYDSGGNAECRDDQGLRFEPLPSPRRLLMAQLREVDPHHDPPECGPADLGEPGGREDAAAADVELAPGDALLS